MTYTPVPTFLTGDTIDEPFLNTYWRDNMAAGVPDVFSAKGQLAIASGVDTMGVLNPGTDGSVLITEAAQSLGVRWDHFLNQVVGPQGFGLNYQISRTVVSNNLVIALKDKNGNDPTPASPVTIRIGNTMRTITAALSFTANAGQNYANLGGAENSTQDVDLFVYLGWRASDSSVFIAAARIPWAFLYSHFSTTVTLTRYAMFSGAAPAGTDEVALIGRFNATLGVSATYLWSIPATSIVINWPVMSTRWMKWVPTITGYSAVPGSASYSYKVSGDGLAGGLNSTAGVFHIHVAEPLNGTSNATTHTYTLPLTLNGGGVVRLPDAQDNAVPVESAYVTIGSTTIQPFPSHSASWTASGGSRMGVFQAWLPGA